MQRKGDAQTGLKSDHCTIQKKHGYHYPECQVMLEKWKNQILTFPAQIECAGI